MREIKYKAYDKEHYRIFKENKIFDVLRIVFRFGKISEVELSTENGDILRNIEDVNLLQFTGIKDSEGRDIYEGDVIAVNNKYPKIIEYSAEHFGFVMINISDLEHRDWKEIKQRPSAHWFDDFKREIKIIGNIYENEELLKK